MLSLLGITQRQVYFLLSLGIIYSGLEGIGVGMLLPVLEYVEKGSAMFEQDKVSQLTVIIVRLCATLGLTPGLAVLFVFAFIPIFARQILRYGSQVYAGKIRFEAIGRIRKDGFTSFLEAKVPFCVSEGQGRLVNVLTTEVERGASALPLFLQLCEGVILVSVYLILLLFLAPRLVPVVLIATGAFVLLIRTKIQKSRAYGVGISKSNEALHTAASETLSGIRLVKMKGMILHETQKFTDIVNAMTSSQLKICRVKQGIEASTEPIMMVGAFAALYLAVSSLGMTLSSLGMFVFVLMRVGPLLRQVNVARQEISSLSGSLNNVQHVIGRAKAANDVSDGALIFAGLQREIAFDHVSFSYGDRHSKWALQDISFGVPKGHLTAIVGRSGAGKSTLLDLILRFRDVSSGDIIIDGISINKFDVRSLRSAIGIVDQQGFMFNDTIASNISYGMPEVSREEIVKAAKKAHAHHFIEELTNGYDTVTGENGVRLSVGQRQRICLARVLLQNPDILLLDEPTSSLDSESEQYIQLVLDSLRKSKAIIVVAHRLSTIRQAEQIIVLDRGRIVEHGNHDTLLKHWGTYKQLFDLQIRV